MASSTQTRHTGRVKKWFAGKGFGFIAREGERDLFVHVTALSSDLRRLADGGQLEGTEVTFTVTKGPKGLAAESVRTVGVEAADLETMFVVFRSGRKGPRAFTLSDNKPVFPDRCWGTPKPQADEGWEVAVAGEDPGKTCYFVRPVRGPFPVIESKGNTHHLAGLKAAIEDGTAVLGGEVTMKYQSPSRCYVLLDRSTYDAAHQAAETKKTRKEEICREAGLERYDALSIKVVRAVLQGFITVEEIAGMDVRDAFHYVQGKGYELDGTTDEWVIK